MMTRERALFGAGILAFTVLLATSGLVRSEEQSAAEKARLKKLDDGPRTIDVSKYPPAEKEAYALFAKKCVKCHSLGRAINTPFVLPDQWERYIKRMLYKPDSKLKEEDAKAIYQFLVYDGTVRKADSLREQLAGLPVADRAKAVEKIRALNPAFKPEK